MNPSNQLEQAADRHRQRLAPKVRPHIERHRRKEPHPVYDFLFEYYTFRPNQLLQWSPGFKETEAFAACFSNDWKFPVHRIQALEWVVGLLERTSGRTPRFQCFGLHEWAMVYNPDDVRHKHLELRLPHEAVKRLVEQRPLVCSHYDAFRFFSNEAKPQNRTQLERTTQDQHEQPGCLHANMDLYKWAYKFYPWTPSDLIADAFELAWNVREMDMRASPYDLAHLGFEPIRIETREGREEYAALQKQFAQQAQPVRNQLLDMYRHLLKDQTPRLRAHVAADAMRSP